MKRPLLSSGGSLLAVAALLAGCSQPIKEVPDQSGAQSSVQSGSQSGIQSGETALGDVALTEDQVRRIVADVQASLDQAQADNDSAVLEQRLMNPALQMRQSQMIRADKTGEELAPLQITADVYSATAGDSWPRVLVVASNAEGDTPAELFFITQQEAKGDYKLENWTRLVGGTSVKGLSVRDGSVVLSDDASGFVMTPADTVTNYVNFLNNPDSEEYALFDDNVFAPRYREELSALNEAVEVAGNVSATAETGDYPISAVALNTGSAVVSAAFTYKTVYQKTVVGSTLTMAGTPASYLDDPDVKGSVTVEYLVMVFFLVPPADSGEKVSVIGSERSIISVSRDDTAPTE